MALHRFASASGHPLTVIPLGDAVLYPPPLGEVGYLGPILIGTSARAEGAAVAVGRVASLGH